jgi:hypothetical protein
MYINKFQIVNGKYVQQKVTYKRNYCKDCKHYNKNGEVCRLFTLIDVVSGNEKIVKAIDARNNVDMCGHDAVVYQKRIIKNDIYDDNVLT